MAFSRKVIVLTVFFACLGTFVFYSGLQADKDTNTAITVRKNFDVPGWRHTDLHNVTAVLDALKANITVFADYSRDDRSPSVNLYIGYYDSLEKARLSHAPQVCFTAQGWIIQKNDKVMLDFSDKKKEVNRLLLEKDNQRLLVYYWYQTVNKSFADLYKMKLDLLYNKLVKGKEFQPGNAFVRVSTMVVGDVRQAKLRLATFVTNTRKPLQRLYGQDKR